jgi:hypothetical protein
VGKAPLDRFSHPPNVKRPHRLAMPHDYRAVSVSCGGNYTAIRMRDCSVWVLGDDDHQVRPLPYLNDNPVP